MCSRVAVGRLAFFAATSLACATANTTATVHQYPEAAVQQCKIPLSQYNTIDRIAAQCAAATYWKAKADDFDKAGNSCVTNVENGRMTCGFDTGCFGSGSLRHTFTETTMTYDCGGKCDGSLFFSCCDECARNQKKATEGALSWADTVHCLGCSATLVKARASTLQCDLQDGKFVCAYHGNCTMHDPTNTVEDYACDIYPCNRCLGKSKGEQLRAECCSSCLEKMCSGPTERMSCQGCTVPAPEPEAESPECKSPWWYWLLLGVSICVLISGMCAVYCVQTEFGGEECALLLSGCVCAVRGLSGSWLWLLLLSVLNVDSLLHVIYSLTDCRLHQRRHCESQPCLVFGCANSRSFARFFPHNDHVPVLYHSMACQRRRCLARWLYDKPALLSKPHRRDS